MKDSTKFKTAMLLTSLAVAAGATAAAILLQKKREEEVYHEAELKAMDELERMMRAESDCADCSCAEECAAPDSDMDIFDHTESDDDSADPDIEVEIFDAGEDSETES